MHCAETFERARHIEKMVDDELEALGLLTSDKKEQPSQVGEFLGLAYYTVLGAFVLLPGKVASLALGGRGIGVGRERGDLTEDGHTVSGQSSMVLCVPGRREAAHQGPYALDRVARGGGLGQQEAPLCGGERGARLLGGQPLLDGRTP